MLIRRPVEEVFDAFVNPEITTKFWFTKSSGTLAKGKVIRWEWKMNGVWDKIFVRDLEVNRRIVIEFSDRTFMEWTFLEKPENHTFVRIEHYGFDSYNVASVNRAMDSMGNLTAVLCGLKALLEHHIRLYFIEDQNPDILVQQ
ncbi:polyketide cyclase [Radiobacillus deserti]|uniref:Polyketide cyclase n=2 Tax=Radiobacillus deserti TaxID=2594883 RepID=A0A516KLA3_9BACI|nr:polyketide cyclase [Radiobacillus deserti]